jgi:hypothetical protein
MADQPARRFVVLAFISYAASFQFALTEIYAYDSQEERAPFPKQLNQLMFVMQIN